MIPQPGMDVPSTSPTWIRYSCLPPVLPGCQRRDRIGSGGHPVGAWCGLGPFDVSGPGHSAPTRHVHSTWSRVGDRARQHLRPHRLSTCRSLLQAQSSSKWTARRSAALRHALSSDVYAAASASSHATCPTCIRSIVGRPTPAGQASAASRPAESRRNGPALTTTTDRPRRPAAGTAGGQGTVTAPAPRPRPMPAPPSVR